MATQLQILSLADGALLLRALDAAPATLWGRAAVPRNRGRRRTRGRKVLWRRPALADKGEVGNRCGTYPDVQTYADDFPVVAITADWDDAIQSTSDPPDGKARYEGLTLAEWAPKLVDEIVRGFDPVQVILFGSVARGEESSDSDLDLLVVLPHVEPADKMRLVVEIRKALTACVPKDIFVADPAEIERRRDEAGSLHYWPLREGRVLYERAA